MLNFAIWLAVGAVIGLVAGLLMHDEDDSGVFLNVVVGIVGALVAGWLAAPYVGLTIGNAKAASLGALAMALLGAVALLALVSAVRARRRRPR